MERKKDRWLAIVVLTFGIIYVVTTLNLPRAPVGNPMGPLYFPLGFGILTIVVGSIMLFQNMGHEKVSGQEKEVIKKPKRYLQVFFGVLLCLSYAVLFDLIGFVVSTLFFLVAFLFILNGGKKWFVNLSIAFLYTVGVWYLFEKVFLISLP
ncbi:MAG: tripartite tricarboxylate transporter TctB family protein [Pseudothermotoga sp.]